MKKLRTALALVLLAVPALAPAEMQKAKTIDELAAMFDSTNCKECHETHYAQWEKSHHARPFLGVAGGMMLTPVVKAGPFKITKPEDATLKTFPCFKCHLPQAVRVARKHLAEDFAIAEARLAGREWFFDHFTTPAAYFFWCVRRAKSFKIDLAAFPSVLAHFDRVERRPSVQKVIAYEKQVIESFAKAA